MHASLCMLMRLTNVIQNKENRFYTQLLITRSVDYLEKRGPNFWSEKLRIRFLKCDFSGALKSQVPLKNADILTSLQLICPKLWNSRQNNLNVTKTIYPRG